MANTIFHSLVRPLLRLLHGLLFVAAILALANWGKPAFIDGLRLLMTIESASLAWRLYKKGYLTRPATGGGLGRELAARGPVTDGPLEQVAATAGLLVLLANSILG